MHKRTGKNKATLSGSPNKGDLRGLKLTANEHSSSVLSWPGHLFFTERGLSGLCPRTDFYFLCWGEGLPRGYLQGEKKSDFNLKQFTYLANNVYVSFIIWKIGMKIQFSSKTVGRIE